jgi:hypothetical protein
MKEVSLFFGDLIRYLPIEHESVGDNMFILSSKLVFQIGDYFVRHLFFGDLIRYLPIEHESVGDNMFILSSKLVFQIGDYFVRHLFETRHRGAFELAYVGFTSVCETFWKCKSNVYNQQPNKWLEHVLELIQSDKARFKLCSTRRGGEIPFFFQALKIFIFWL